MRGRIRMLGRQAIADCERAHARRTASLRRHAAMARDRAGAIAAAVKEQQHARGVGAWRERPFAPHAAAIDRLAADVAGHGPDRAKLVEPRPPLGPADRPRLFRQHRPDGVDLFVRHDLPRAAACLQMPPAPISP
jgi:hypothetical protein